MAGSTFNPRDMNSTVGDFFNNPILDSKLTQESWAKTPWASLTGDMEINDNGLVVVDADLSSSAIVKSVDIGAKAGTTEARFAYQKGVDGEPTFGQQIGGRADRNVFLYDSVEIAEVRSPIFDVLSDREQRLSANVIGDARALADKNASAWCTQRHCIEHIEALTRGESQQGLSLSPGALGHNLGGVNNGDANGTTTIAGSQVLHELIYLPNAAGTGVAENKLATDTGTARKNYEDTVATALAALQGVATPGTGHYLTRDSMTGLRYWAEKNDIKMVNGADHDYVLVADWELVRGLVRSQNDDALLDIFKLMVQGGADKSVLMDRRQRSIIIDGVKVIPDRLMQAFRPSTATTNNGASVVYGGSGSTQSSYYTDKIKKFNTNLGNTGLAFFLGESALLKAKNGGITMMAEEGDFQTGVSVGTREFRNIKRGVWRGKDPSAAGQIVQCGSIQAFFRVPTDLGLISG